MASSIPSQPTGSPPPTPTSSNSSAGQGNNYSTTNATLYLYTFLATLVLLLAVSSAIVIRSLILRRRHQRLVEDAIRTGTWMPNRFDSTTGRRRRDIGQKPKLWEVWPHPTGDDSEHEVDEKSKWGDVMPFYAAYVNSPTSSPQGPALLGFAETTADPSRSRPLHRFITRSFTRRSSPASAASMTTTTTVATNVTASSTGGPVLASSTSPSSAPGSTPAVRVAVLIAMPSPPPSRKRGTNAESGAPVVEIGVVEADVKDSEDAEITPTISTPLPMPMPKLARNGS